MEKDLFTYALIKGFQSTSDAIELKDLSLCSLSKPKNINAEFFKRIEEMLKCCVETMGVPLASEYFNLSPELIEGIVEKNVNFIEKVKKSVKERSSVLNPNTPVLPLPLISMAPPNTTYAGYNPSSNPKVARNGTLAHLPEHRPSIGTIYNPDYSYTPDRFSSN